MLKLGSESGRQLFEYITVFWLIASSGAVFFSLSNMKLTMAILLIIAFIWAVINNWKIKKDNLYISVCIISFLVMNTLSNFSSTISIEDCMIMIIKILSLVVIQSAIYKREFILKYINVLVVLSAISIFCFVLYYNGFKTFPFLVNISVKGNVWPATFYYFPSFHTITTRNNGIFWEPGVYQEFINIAILFQIYKMVAPENSSSKTAYIDILKLGILMITLLTTQSSTGYICTMLIIMYLMLQNKSTTRTSRLIKIFGLCSMLFLGLVESNMGLLEEKLLNQQGSYAVRSNDTTGSFAIGLTKPMIGYGMFNNDIINNLLDGYGIGNISNGIGSFVIRLGFLITGIYFIYITYRFRKFLECKFLQILCIGVFIFLCFSTEVTMTFPIWMTFLFKWKDENATKINWQSNKFKIVSQKFFENSDHKDVNTKRLI